jgi:hypothetical protein
VSKYSRVTVRGGRIIIRSREGKSSCKMAKKGKKLKTQINGKFNDTSIADENK